MRHWILVVLLFLLMGGVTGCGDGEAATTAAPTTMAAPTTTTEATTTTTVAVTTATTVPAEVTLVVRFELAGGVGGGDAAGTFVATGAAVDRGLVCPAGSVEWTLRSRTETANYYQEEATLTGTCDGGEGGFTLETDAKVRYGIVGTIDGTWTGEGTGSLTGWIGEGTKKGSCSETGAPQFYDCEIAYTGAISART